MGADVLAEPGGRLGEGGRGDLGFAGNGSVIAQGSRKAGIERAGFEVQRHLAGLAPEQVGQSERGGEADGLSVPARRAGQCQRLEHILDPHIGFERVDHARTRPQHGFELGNLHPPAGEGDVAPQVQRIADGYGIEPEKGILELGGEPPGRGRFLARQRHEAFDVNGGKIERAGRLGRRGIDVHGDAGREAAPGDLGGADGGIELAVAQLHADRHVAGDGVAGLQGLGAQLQIGIDIAQGGEIHAAARTGGGFAGSLGRGGLGGLEVGIVQMPRCDLRHHIGTVAGRIAGIELHGLAQRSYLAAGDAIAAVIGELDAARGAEIGQHGMERLLGFRRKGEVGRLAGEELFE